MHSYVLYVFTELMHASSDIVFNLHLTYFLFPPFRMMQRHQDCTQFPYLTLPVDSHSSYLVVSMRIYRSELDTHTHHCIVQYGIMLVNVQVHTAHMYVHLKTQVYV